MDKSKIINIILVVLAIVVLCVCLFIMFTYKGEVGSEIILLKDMNSDEVRVIDDKTDIYNNEDGTITIKGEKPDNYMEPDDLFNKDDEEEILDNEGNAIESIFAGNPNNGELKEYEPGEDVIVLQEEIPEVIVIEDRISLQDAIRTLRGIRSGKTSEISVSSIIGLGESGTVLLSDMMGENGLIIVPFTFENEKQIENLKKWSAVYDIYKDDIPIIFLDVTLSIYTMNRDTSIATIRTELEKRGVNSNIPIYRDEMGEIFALSNNITVDELGYCIIDRDAHIFKQSGLDIDLSTIREDITELKALTKEYIEQEELITQKYEEGLIRDYPDVQKALDGTLEEVIEEETEAEDDTTE